MHQPQQRTSRLRAVTLASAIALAVALALAAAVAGQDTRLAAKAFRAAHQHQNQQQDQGRRGEAGAGGGSGADDAAPEAHPSDVRPPTGARPATSCGPEIASPEGVTVRACVLTADGATWARAYYRNPTAHRLPALLTLHRPDGRTAKAHCTVRGGGERGVCETPHGRGVKAAQPGREVFSAVVEVGHAEGRRPLRAKSGQRQR
ncbi:hypothetical protein ITI46_29165 [Streptomyces oryzae]|uniref:Uncharacterized protein n=1 Tax=Streptomyces oryzae TaxID=1434886 RepID=A0ABS3XJV1_9ACTN|nr:hypothetical protein [Streptomyces oryzae]MBO8195690.1 hypothetical protein [Streptomyces oryzae]